jgi:hypothetical protein
MRTPVTDRPPVTEEEIAVVRGWIASVRRGETPDTERDLIVAEVLERWLDGESYEEMGDLEPRARAWMSRHGYSTG